MRKPCTICGEETEHEESHTVKRRYYENRDTRDDVTAYRCTQCDTIRL